MKITNRLLTTGAAHGRTGTALTPKGVVLHYVGNPNSTAENNRSWFENGAGGAHTSAHYIVGLQGETLRLIPETERAQHAGKSYGAKWGEMAKTNNSRYIGIEVCHPDSTGKFNDNTYASLVELVADICKRYGFNPEKDVVRHYDITGKACPLYYVNRQCEWVQLLNEINTVVGGNSYTPPEPPAIKMPTLRRGDKNTAVREMQERINLFLRTTGKTLLNADGSFGPLTETAVRTYQAAKGLAVDGICGPKTWAALLA